MASTSASQTGGTVLAHSALLTLTATPTDDALALQVTRVSDHRQVTGVGKVTATLDGRRIPLTSGPNGAYLLSLGGEGAGAHKLRVVVAHDGIRELLTGTVDVARHRSILESLEGHGMAAWWVLNVAVVLIAVMIISRRRGG